MIAMAAAAIQKPIVMLVTETNIPSSAAIPLSILTLEDGMPVSNEMARVKRLQVSGWAASSGVNSARSAA